MKIGSKSQKLLKHLFKGKLAEAAEAAKTLQNFSFSATSDPTIVLITAGILVCATKNEIMGFDTTSLRTETDKLFHNMGCGNCSTSKSTISGKFKDLVTKHTIKGKRRSQIANKWFQNRKNCDKSNKSHM